MQRDMNSDMAFDLIKNLPNPIGLSTVRVDL